MGVLQRSRPFSITHHNQSTTKNNLEASILSALVQIDHGYAASKIKYINGEAWYRNVAHKIAHAVAGCAAAEAGKNKCQDGAIGAAVGEIVGEALVNNTDFSGMTPEQIARDLCKTPRQETAGTFFIMFRLFLRQK